MRSKRKGTDMSTAQHSAVPVVSSNHRSSIDGNNGSDWSGDTKQILANFRLNSSSTGSDIMTLLGNVLASQASFQQEKKLIDSETERIKNKLEDRIQQARESCREESDDLYRTGLQLQQLRADVQSLHQGLDDVDTTERETRERIIQYQKEASEEIEAIDQVEAQKKQQVPRLKQQISLYANTTNIKWDYEQEHVLAGQVAIESSKGDGRISQFCIDPKEYSEFEIANHLWSLIEGNSSSAILA